MRVIDILSVAWAIVSLPGRVIVGTIRTMIRYERECKLADAFYAQCVDRQEMERVQRGGGR